MVGRVVVAPEAHSRVGARTAVAEPNALQGRHQQRASGREPETISGPTPTLSVAAVNQSRCRPWLLRTSRSVRRLLVEVGEELLDGRAGSPVRPVGRARAQRVALRPACSRSRPDSVVAVAAADVGDPLPVGRPGRRRAATARSADSGVTQVREVLRAARSPPRPPRRSRRRAAWRSATRRGRSRSRGRTSAASRRRRRRAPRRGRRCRRGRSRMRCGGRRATRRDCARARSAARRCRRPGRVDPAEALEDEASARRATSRVRRRARRRAALGIGRPRRRRAARRRHRPPPRSCGRRGSRRPRCR